MTNQDALIVMLLGIIRKQQSAMASIAESVQESNEYTAEGLARLGYPNEGEVND